MPKALHLTERTCMECNTLKDIDEYYKNGKTSYFKKCKICMCKIRQPYVKREPKERVKSLILRKFDELTKEVLDEIIRQRGALVPLTSIARLNDLPHHWLKKWKLVGLI